jgi:hypothetical protein
MKERISMNNNNASLQRNQVNDFTLPALEVMLKLLNGYELQMGDATPSNTSVLFVRKGNNFSTYVRQNLMKTNNIRLMAFAKAQEPMSEVDKIKQAMVKESVERPVPEVVKLANGVLGNFGAHARFRDLYESGQYLRLFETACSFASKEQMAHAQQQMTKAQIPFLDGLFREFAHNNNAMLSKNSDAMLRA